MVAFEDNESPYLTLVEGSAPSAPSAGQRRLYILSSDHLAYLKDSSNAVVAVGGTPSEITDIPTANTTTTNVLAPDGAGGVEWRAESGGSAGGWTQVVNESGASFSNFTGLSGTWASNGTIIQQTGTGGSIRRAKYNVAVDSAMMVAQVDVRFPTGGSATRAGGLLLGWGGTDVSNTPMSHISTEPKIVIGQDALSEVFADGSITVSLDTWYTLRVRVAGDKYAAYLDGTFKGAAHVQENTDTALVIGLKSYDGGVDFRNFKVWVLDMP